MNELDKHSHPPHNQNKCLYNIVMGKIVSDINVAEALSIGKQMMAKFVSGLPENFHSNIISPVKSRQGALDHPRVAGETFICAWYG